MIKNKYNKLILRFYALLLILSFIVNTGISSDIGKKRTEELKERIDNILTSVDCDVSVKVVSTSQNDILYQYKPDIKMIPASITKVVTSTTAIYVLGSGYQFKTGIYTDDTRTGDGIIRGNVYIKGFGDPDFSSADVYNLAQQFVNKNITEITGNIIYDVSYLDDAHYGLANYYQSDTKAQYWPYVGAINLDKNKGYKNPAESAAQLFANKITQNVKLDGIVVSGTTPQGARELAVVLRSLYDALVNMNKPSDNQSAITIYKVIGANYSSPPGTLGKGSDAVKDFLTTVGIDRGMYEFVEGSGLSRYNYVTSDVYIKLLKYIFNDEKTFDIFYNSLPISGIDGTLKTRMIGTEAEKNIHAKTGTINNVSTLTGYAVSRDNELLSFYIAMNNFSGNANFYRDKQDEICEAICEFSRK
jgi:D-alanyl-D-alanine carboxypeptidase/D-alanyl-D-alanine-endopeptidase (penicillin-binding protein 4)